MLTRHLATARVLRSKSFLHGQEQVAPIAAMPWRLMWQHSSCLLRASPGGSASCASSLTPALRQGLCRLAAPQRAKPCFWLSCAPLLWPPPYTPALHCGNAKHVCLTLPVPLPFFAVAAATAMLLQEFCCRRGEHACCCNESFCWVLSRFCTCCRKHHLGLAREATAKPAKG